MERITLEMSLKPFTSLAMENIEAVCEEALRQWMPLIGETKRCSIMLWSSDGSEILEWNGDYEQEMEWARYIGFSNKECFNLKEGEPKTARLYTDHPVRMTYGALRDIVAAFKRIGCSRFGLEVEVGATFDAGPEFAHSDFKYHRHPEINEAVLGGKPIQLRSHYQVICVWSRLKGDDRSYAGFPDGIPEGTSFGTFLGRQCASFLPALGFDYIWFSNGFGFSYFPWTYLGANYDGRNFGHADYAELTGKLLSFWDDYRRECPDYRIEVRGTNFGTGMDLAKDYIPLKELYDRKLLELPPPNSPWGPLNKDYGLEMAGYMSRIAYLPGTTFPYRCYVNDPWFWQNPWWDYYNRQPYDIYLPLSICRLKPDGSAQGPGIVEILTIDTEFGELNPDCPAEVIPHLKRALADFPDEAGVLTWLYPFREYHEAVAADPEAAARTIFLEEWFIRNSINEGLPLNTVVSTDDWLDMGAEAARRLKERTVLLVPGSLLAGNWLDRLRDYTESGGQLYVYGPVGSEAARQWLDLAEADGISGDVELSTALQRDRLTLDQLSSRFYHEEAVSAGGLREVPGGRGDGGTKIHAVVRQGGADRVFALSRRLPEWQGGKAVWIRGSLPFATGRVSSLPVKKDADGGNPADLTRHLLSEFGYVIRQIKPESKTIPGMLFIASKDNALWFNGFKHNTTVSFSLRTPHGAPLVLGESAVLEDGCACYSLDRVFHGECRFYVRQQSGVVSCMPVSPIATPGNARPLRAVEISGLEQAEVTICPPLDALREGRVEISSNRQDWESAAQEGEARHIRLNNRSGSLYVCW